MTDRTYSADLDHMLGSTFGRDFVPPTYHDVVLSLGYDLIASEDAGTYSGDSAYVLADAAGRIGFLVFGWGSCSGCDALEACVNREEVIELRADLAAGIVWFESPEAFREWAAQCDWDTQWHDFGPFASRAAKQLVDSTFEEVGR